MGIYRATTPLSQVSFHWTHRAESASFSLPLSLLSLSLSLLTRLSPNETYREMIAMNSHAKLSIRTLRARPRSSVLNHGKNRKKLAWSEVIQGIPLVKEEGPNNESESEECSSLLHQPRHHRKHQQQQRQQEEFPQSLFAWSPPTRSLVLLFAFVQFCFLIIAVALFYHFLPGDNRAARQFTLSNARIAAHNRRQKERNSNLNSHDAVDGPLVLGHNQFSLLTEEEYKQRMGLISDEATNRFRATLLGKFSPTTRRLDSSLPESLDWTASTRCGGSPGGCVSEVECVHLSPLSLSLSLSLSHTS